MDAAENVLRAGDRLDRYELLCPIATGGMATVWLARMRGKRGFEKLFAVKTIRTELVEDPRFQEMFLDEARIASGIQHPNVAQILDLGEQRDVLFIVMEWVDGDSLAKVRKLAARQGVPLPIGVALRALADACAGLHAAHELRDEHGRPLGIVHRDVSPQNILVGASGTIKVIDFGIAKAHNRRQGETGTGVVKGKIQYMAPEQVKKGRSVDRRTDVWALGVCLHELVSGRFPNDGDDDVEVIRKLLADEKPRRAADLPEPVTRILDRSLALDPDDRFPTAAAMQRALEAAMNDVGHFATSDDVASFLRAELPELAERRRAIVARAIEDARERIDEPRQGAEGDEVAFAPTIVHEDSSGARKTGATPIALTKRKASAPPDVAPEPERLPRPPEPRPLWPAMPHAPRHRGTGVWAVGAVALLGLGGSAFFVRSLFIGPADLPRAARATAQAPVAAAAPPSPEPSRAPSAPDDSAVAPLEPSPPQAASRPKGAADAGDAIEVRPAAPVAPASIDSGIAAVDVLDARAAQTTAAADDAELAEAGAAPSSSSASAASVHEAAAPAAPDDDSNNPYN
ncbi:MAG: serine/threonine protein kinase [Polyangiaceae bacterium]|nr:serine/threonine protein kinase [Polyangiaceae bacterium]